MAWDFAPTAFTSNGTDYSGAVTAIDEWPPVGGAGELLQSLATAAAATRIGTVDFDLSTADNLDRGLMMVMVHAGTQAGGWTVSAQLRVTGGDVGAPVVVSRPGESGVNKYSFFYWPDSVLSTVAGDPDTVQVRWTATNLHSGSQQHRINAIHMWVSPLTGAPPLPPGLAEADVVAAWDLNATFSLWSDGGAIEHLPDLIGGSHLVRSQGSMAFEDDDAVVPAAGIPSDTLYGGQIPATMSNAWMVHVIKTAPDPLLEDHEPVISNFINEGAVDGGAVPFASINYKCLSTLDIGEGLVGGWGLMCNNLSVHSFSDGWDDNGTAFPGSTWFLQVVNVRSGASTERMYVSTGAPITASDIVINEDGGGTTSQLRSIGLLNREDGSRGRAGWWAASYIMDGSLTEEEALFNANVIGDFHELFAFGDSPSPGDSPGDSPVDGDPFPHTCFSRQWRRCC